MVTGLMKKLTDDERRRATRLDPSWKPDMGCSKCKTSAEFCPCPCKCPICRVARDLTGKFTR